MNARNPDAIRSVSSDLSRVDGHVIEESEYEELPELTEDMLARARVLTGGRPVPEVPADPDKPGSPAS